MVFPLFNKRKKDSSDVHRTQEVSVPEARATPFAGLESERTFQRLFFNDPIGTGTNLARQVPFKYYLFLDPHLLINVRCEENAALHQQTTQPRCACTCMPWAVVFEFSVSKSHNKLGSFHSLLFCASPLFCACFLAPYPSNLNRPIFDLL